MALNRRGLKLVKFIKTLLFILCGMSLSGCMTIKPLLPAKKLKTKAFQVSIPCPIPEKSGVYVAEMDLRASKKGIDVDNVQEYSCHNGTVGLFFVSFGSKGLAALDAYIQYLHDRN